MGRALSSCQVASCRPRRTAIVCKTAPSHAVATPDLCGTTDPPVSHWAGARVSILRSAVLPAVTALSWGHKMSRTADISEPASELEHLMADLSGLEQLVFVFGDDFA